MLDNFFDFLFRIPIVRKFKPFYEKRKDIVLYIFFGGLTTVVSFVTFWFFVDVVNFVITSYSIHYTKLYEVTTCYH